MMELKALGKCPMRRLVLLGGLLTILLPQGKKHYAHVSLMTTSFSTMMAFSKMIWVAKLSLKIGRVVPLSVALQLLHLMDLNLELGGIMAMALLPFSDKDLMLDFLRCTTEVKLRTVQQKIQLPTNTLSPMTLPWL